ncbi:unnamed protein product, partial [Tetraodon nigroviridis]
AKESWGRDSHEMRYKRLQHLLQKSNIYSKFLLTKMEQQQNEEEAQVSKKIEAEDIERSSDSNQDIKNRLSEAVRDNAKHLLDPYRKVNGEPVPAQQPQLFTGGVMRWYQIEGIEWLRMLWENGINGILADEMGLGKTIQCIAHIAMMIERKVMGPFLVVAPLSTLPNWISEFKRFTPEVSVLLYHGPQAERTRLLKQMRRPQGPLSMCPVVVTSFEIAMIDRKFLQIDEQLVQSSGKFLILDRMLPALKRRGHKVLIFSQMTSILDILMDYCFLRGFQYSRLDGSMTFADREENITKFSKDPQVFLFLLSTRAGGLGINLTAADTVIIFDSDWNPQADLQAQDRCHRIGQTKPVVVYRLVTANTIDQKILERASNKRKLEQMVIHKNKFKGGKSELNQSKGGIDLNELMELLKTRRSECEMTVSKGKVISDKDLEILLDRTDLLGEIMLCFTVF